jgi:hypothetical protein
VIHYTALFLLSKLGILDLLKKYSKRFFISNIDSNYILAEYSENKIELMPDNEDIYYDDISKGVVDFIQENPSFIRRFEDIEEFSNEAYKNIEPLDKSVFKALYYAVDRSNIQVLTEDHLFLSSDVKEIKSLSTGVLSFIIDCFVDGHLTNQQLIGILIKLESINYSPLFEKTIYQKLVSYNFKEKDQKIFEILYRNRA